MKKYVKIDGAQGVTHLKIELYYSLGGMNYFTYAQEKRGYYLSVSPVEHVERGGYTLESCTAFSGVKQLVKTVSRRSAKAEATAEENAKNYIGGLVRHVCQKNGLQIPAGYELHPEAAEGGAEK